MLELSVGRTQRTGITSGGGPATAAAGIGTGKWIADRVMLGLEARAHGTIDIEESVPSVRFVSGVVAWRPTSGQPVVRLAAGPAWIANGNSRATRTLGYSASLELPTQPDLTKASWVWFLRYSGTGTVSIPSTSGAAFNVRHFTLGLRLEL